MKSACILMICPLTNMVLAVSRKDDPNAWGLPGGKLEGDESEEEAARRELQEETGIVLYHTLGSVCKLDEVYRRDDSVTFLARTDMVYKVLGRTEPAKVQWVTWEQLFAGPFGEYNRHLFNSIYTLERA